MIHPLSQAEADRVKLTPAQKLDEYDNLMRNLVPCWQIEFQRSTAQMWKAFPAASDPNGSLKDLATFILAANASENNQVKLLGAAAYARSVHPMSKARFGT